MKDKTLVIISHKKHELNPSTGKVRVHGGFLPITNEIATHFERVLLCVPVAYHENVEDKKYASNIEICPLPFYKSRGELMRSIPRIWKKLWYAAAQSDLVYVMGPDDMAILGLAVARLSRKPTFISFDTDRASVVKTYGYGFIHKTFKVLFNRWLIYPYFRMLARSIPAFITGDMFLGRSPHWHQWVKTTHTANQIASPLMRKIDLNKISLVFAGRLSPEKNIPLLINALAKLRRSSIQAELVVIGDGSEEEKLREIAGSLGINDFVHFVGRLAHNEILESKFWGADLLVLPSVEERQGKVLLEAMACGIPVIASNAGGIPSVITHRCNGLLFDPSSVDDLVETVKTLINDDELRFQLIRQGHEFARRHTLEAGINSLVGIVKNHYFSGETVVP